MKDKATFDWDELYEAAYNITTLMDNLIDVSEFPDERFKDVSIKYRNIGIGFMGLSDVMYMLNIRYDSVEGRRFAKEIMKTIETATTERSSELAYERGCFYDYEKHRENVLEITSRLIDDEEVLEKVEKYGLRNVARTTVAPTGCLVDSSLVASSEGLKEIIDYADVNMLNLKTKSDIGTYTFKKWYDQGFAKTIKIKTFKGYELEGTYDHKVRVLKTVDGVGNCYVWKKLEEIKKGDMVVLKKNFILSDKKIVDLNMAEFLGLYMADGWWNNPQTAKNGRLYISTNDKDVDYVENLLRSINLNFNFNFNIIRRKSGENCTKIEVNSDKLFQWFKENNCVKYGSYNAFIPDVILNSGREVILAFIRGYLKGDGHIRRGNGNVGFTTISEKLAKQLHVLLLGIGIPTNLSEYQYDENKVFKLLKENREFKQNHNVFKINITGYYSKILLETIGITSNIEYTSNTDEKIPLSKDERKIFKYFNNRHKICCVSRHKYTNLIEKKDYNWFVENDLYLDKVASAEYSEELKHVCDMEIREEGHTYIANGFVTHNTTAISADCSYGMEPCFGLVFRKNLVNGDTMHFVNPIFEKKFKNEEWYNDKILAKIAKNGGSLKGIHGIPKEVKEVFVVAHDIKPKDRIEMQAVLTQHVDSAISSTVNLPHDSTKEEVSKLYKYAYEKGLKGVTIYRDGCKKNQPITFKEEKKEFTNFERPVTLIGETHRINTANGHLYVTVNKLPNGDIIEIMPQLGKGGNEMNSMTEAVGRLLSTGLQERLTIEKIIKQLKGINDKATWYKFNEDDPKPVQILSIPDAIAKLLEKKYVNGKNENSLGIESDERCPKCGNNLMVMEGCLNCVCGYSKCS